MTQNTKPLIFNFYFQLSHFKFTFCSHLQQKCMQTYNVQLKVAFWQPRSQAPPSFPSVAVMQATGSWVGPGNRASILAGVFLSSLCVVPESSYSSNTTISSLLVAWSSNCSTAPSQWWLHSKTSKCSAPALFMWTTIGFTQKLCRLHPRRAQIYVV